MLEAADQNLSPTQNCIPDGVGNGLITGGHREAPVNGHTVYPTGTEHKPLNANITSDSTIQAIAVSLVENRRLTPETHWQDVRHLSFTSQTPASYGAGDVLTIYPKNSSGDVDQLLSRMSWIDMADRPIRLKPTGVIHEKIPYPASPISLPRPITTLRNLLAEHLDLTAIPRRSFFSLIAHFTENKFQKDRLVEFTKPEYIDELYDYTTRPKRSILEVLQEFESVMIPWQWAANVLPELRGRQFSIASGGQLKNELDSSARFELLVAIVKYKTFIKKIREGVCTRYLAALPVGTELRVGLQKGGLAITETEMKRPVIMIGPGTGVAPMRSLIWERLRWAEEHRPDAAGQVVGHPNGTDTAIKNVLFFGGRNKNADFFYSTEWASLQGQMPLAVYPAFSRDQDSKVYVQDRIKEQADLVFSLLHEAGGFVYVCGSSGKMPQAVRAALVDVFQDRGNMDQEAANKYLEGMEKVGRYKQETW